MPLLLLVLALVVAACGGGGAPPSADPDPGPARAVEQFMQAVADSNLTRMAELWGTSRGPAARTGQPDNYQRRLQIMHAYLKGTTTRVLSRIEGTDDRTVLAVELNTAECRRQVAFTVVRLRDGGWVVNDIDLAAVGTPGRPCPIEGRRPG